MRRYVALAALALLCVFTVEGPAGAATYAWPLTLKIPVAVTNLTDPGRGTSMIVTCVILFNDGARFSINSAPITFGTGPFTYNGNVAVVFPAGAENRQPAAGNKVTCQMSDSNGGFGNDSNLTLP
jgi:hypothetical protein